MQAPGRPASSTPESKRSRWHSFRHTLTVGVLTGISAGLLSAAFLWALAGATALRQAHGWLVWGLPVAGWAMGSVLARIGGRSNGGSNLVIDTFFDLGARLPRRMAPMALCGTVATHLFGGSAGREGTAVQLGASLADGWAHQFGASPRQRQDWLRAGVAAGFGAVFGTPLAAILFAAEFFGGRLPTMRDFAGAAVAAWMGDWVCRACGILHAGYPQPARMDVHSLLFGKWLLFAIAMAMATILFVQSAHAVKAIALKFFPSLRWRMAVGGAVVVLCWRLGLAETGLGLGVETILRSFTDPALPPSTFLQKALLTSVTVGTGFLGGEVTPLFLVGASLGNLMSSFLGLPLAMAAAVGMSALFAGAANAPLSMTVMAIELFGLPVLPHVLFVCTVTVLLTKGSNLYTSQRRYFLMAMLLVARGKRETGQPTKLEE